MPDNGLAVFDLIRGYRHDGAAVLCAFDLIELDRSKRLGSPYRSGRADCWVKVKNPAAPAVKREAEGDWNWCVATRRFRRPGRRERQA